MEQKQLAPCFKPTLSLDNIDPQFTNGPVQLTTNGKDIVRKSDACDLAGSEGINPLSMVKNWSDPHFPIVRSAYVAI